VCLEVDDFRSSGLAAEVFGGSDCRLGGVGGGENAGSDQRSSISTQIHAL
jgi:hypothetical protein